MQGKRGGQGGHSIPFYKAQTAKTNGHVWMDDGKSVRG